MHLGKLRGRVDPAELTRGRVDSRAELVSGRVDPLPVMFSVSFSTPSWVIQCAVKITNQNESYKFFFELLPFITGKIFHSVDIGCFRSNSKTTNMANRMNFCVKSLLFSYIIFCAQRHSIALEGKQLFVLKFPLGFGV